MIELLHYSIDSWSGKTYSSFPRSLIGSTIGTRVDPARIEEGEDDERPKGSGGRGGSDGVHSERDREEEELVEFEEVETEWWWCCWDCPTAL